VIRVGGFHEFRHVATVQPTDSRTRICDGSTRRTSASPAKTIADIRGGRKLTEGGYATLAAPRQLLSDRAHYARWPAKGSCLCAGVRNGTPPARRRGDVVVLDMLWFRLMPIREHVVVVVGHHRLRQAARANVAAADDERNIDPLGRHGRESGLQFSALRRAGQIRQVGFVDRRRHARTSGWRHTSIVRPTPAGRRLSIRTGLGDRARRASGCVAPRQGVRLSGGAGAHVGLLANHGNVLLSTLVDTSAPRALDRYSEGGGERSSFERPLLPGLLVRARLG